MQYSDGVAHLLTFFEDTYVEIPVTAETYEAEKALGLYYMEGSLKIPEGTEEIIFTYYTPAGAFIERQNVFVIKDGLQGKSAPQYLGTAGVAPAARANGTPLLKNATYLNTEDKSLYRFDGEEWVAAGDYDPGWWDALGDAVNIAAETGTQIEAANIWVQKLVAGTMLAERLFTQELVLKDPGVLRSENYVEGESGFMIRANGKAEFNDSLFRGTIYATGGVFEDVELKNCTGNIDLVVHAGDNYSLRTLEDCVPTSDEGRVIKTAKPILATGSVLVKFTVNFEGKGSYDETYAWIIYESADGGSEGRTVYGRLHLYDGVCHLEKDGVSVGTVSNGQQISFVAKISYNGYLKVTAVGGVTEATRLWITGIQVRTAEPPGIIEFL